MLTLKRALAIKLETTIGTYVQPATADVVYCEDLKFTPNIESLPRKHHLTTLSNLPPVAGRSYGMISAKIPMYGASAAGSAPFWGTAIQPCGFGETINAGVSVVYKPADTAVKSASVEFDADGILFRMRGAQGTIKADYSSGAIPFFNLDLTGIWEPANDANAVVDGATLVGSAFPAFNPKEFQNAMMKFEGTYRAIIRKMSWDIGNKLDIVPDAGVSGYRRIDITDRNPTGDIQIEAITSATYALFTRYAAKTQIQIDNYVGADDSGTGTGAASSWTDATKNWITNQWAGAKLREYTGTTFPITANTGTVLTVTGTPATGTYVIYQAGKLIYTSIPKAVIDSVSDQATGGIFDLGARFSMNLNTGADELVLTVL